MSDRRVRVSRRLIAALKLGDEPQYRIAQRAGLHPSQLSKLINGAEPLHPNDARVLRVAKVLRVPPGEAFE